MDAGLARPTAKIRPGDSIISDVSPEVFEQDLASAKYPLYLNLTGDRFRLTSLIGATCVKGSAVKELDVQGNALASLDGSGHFGSLRKLNAARNKVVGVTMDPSSHLSILHCDRLAHLDLSHNQLTAFPEVAELKSLQSLHLSHNRIRSLRGRPWASLSECRRLTTLLLDYNQLNLTQAADAYVRPTLEALSRMSSLALEGNPFYDSNVEKTRLYLLGACPKLTTISGDKVGADERRRAREGGGALPEGEDEPELSSEAPDEEELKADEYEEESTVAGDEQDDDAQSVMTDTVSIATEDLAAEAEKALSMVRNSSLSLSSEDMMPPDTTRGDDDGDGGGGGGGDGDDNDDDETRSIRSQEAQLETRWWWGNDYSDSVEVRPDLASLDSTGLEICLIFTCLGTHPTLAPVLPMATGQSGGDDDDDTAVSGGILLTKRQLQSVKTILASLERGLATGLQAIRRCSRADGGISLWGAGRSMIGRGGGGARYFPLLELGADVGLGESSDFVIAWSKLSAVEQAITDTIIGYLVMDHESEFKPKVMRDAEVLGQVAGGPVWGKLLCKDWDDIEHGEMVLMSLFEWWHSTRGSTIQAIMRVTEKPPASLVKAKKQQLEEKRRKQAELQERKKKEAEAKSASKSARAKPPPVPLDGFNDAEHQDDDTDEASEVTSVTSDAASALGPDGFPLLPGMEPSVELKQEGADGGDGVEEGGEEEGAPKPPALDDDTSSVATSEQGSWRDRFMTTIKRYTVGDAQSETTQFEDINSKMLDVVQDGADTETIITEIPQNMAEPPSRRPPPVLQDALVDHPSDADAVIVNADVDGGDGVMVARESAQPQEAEFVAAEPDPLRRRSVPKRLRVKLMEYESILKAGEHNFQRHYTPRDTRDPPQAAQDEEDTGGRKGKSNRSRVGKEETTRANEPHGSSETTRPDPAVQEELEKERKMRMRKEEEADNAALQLTSTRARVKSLELDLSKVEDARSEEALKRSQMQDELNTARSEVDSIRKEMQAMEAQNKNLNDTIKQKDAALETAREESQKMVRISNDKAGELVKAMENERAARLEARQHAESEAKWKKRVEETVGELEKVRAAWKVASGKVADFEAQKKAGEEAGKSVKHLVIKCEGGTGRAEAEVCSVRSGKRIGDVEDVVVGKAPLTVPWSLPPIGAEPAAKVWAESLRKAASECGAAGVVVGFAKQDEGTEMLSRILKESEVDGGVASKVVKLEDAAGPMQGAAVDFAAGKNGMAGRITLRVVCDGDGRGGWIKRGAEWGHGKRVVLHEEDVGQALSQRMGGILLGWDDIIQDFKHSSGGSVEETRVSPQDALAVAVGTRVCKIANECGWVVGGDGTKVGVVLTGLQQYLGKLQRNASAVSQNVAAAQAKADEAKAAAAKAAATNTEHQAADEEATEEKSPPDDAAEEEKTDGHEGEGGDTDPSQLPGAEDPADAKAATDATAAAAAAEEALAEAAAANQEMLGDAMAAAMLQSCLEQMAIRTGKVVFVDSEWKATGTDGRAMALPTSWSTGWALGEAGRQGETHRAYHRDLIAALPSEADMEYLNQGVQETMDKLAAGVDEIVKWKAQATAVSQRLGKVEQDKRKRESDMKQEISKWQQSARKAEDAGNQRAAEVLRWKAEAKRMASTVAKAQADLRIRDERVSKMKRMVEDSENQVMERKERCRTLEARLKKHEADLKRYREAVSKAEMNMRVKNEEAVVMEARLKRMEQGIKRFM